MLGFVAFGFVVQGQSLAQKAPIWFRNLGRRRRWIFLMVVYAVKDEELEEFCLPPSLVPHSAFADFVATVLA